MFLIIIDNNIIVKQTINNYYKYKGINIYKNDNYFIELKDGYHFDDNTLKKQIEIKKFSIFHEDELNEINLYFYESNKGINEYTLYENSFFELSNRINSTILNTDKYLDEYYLSLNNNYLETNFDHVLVNHKKYDGSFLNVGDYIEYLGFSFYYFDSFIYLNRFNIKDIHLNNLLINEKLINKSINLPIINNYYDIPKKGLKIDKLNDFNVPRKGNDRKMILQVGPTITMSLAMIMMASINVYNSLLNSGNRLSIASFLIMPITMLISGILWPILSSNSDKSSYKKEYKRLKYEYLEYLKDYDDELNKKIEDYIKEESYYLFNTKDVKERLFYINAKSKEFLKITLGFQKLSLDFNVKYTKDKEIDEFLNRIKYRVENINNVPLYLDINNNKIVTIIKTNEKEEYLKRVLLELSYKYNYNDLKIGIFSKDQSLFKNLYNIPHTLYKNERLTFVSEQELQDINNSKIDKPLVILLNDYTEYKFSNNKIHVIYFSSSKTKILKDSSLIIELNNNSGTLIKNDKTIFNFYDEVINYDKYFKYISMFSNTNYENKEYMFKDVFPNLNIINNYLLNRNGLRADFGIIGKELLSFDIHESKDGPHGLIGGSTGSGKSELIISFLLSLAIRYSPEYLNIILIDYKGGGIKESLSYGSISIPHIIAAINNLETNTFERLIVAIARECKYRQELFKELSIKATTSIMNIDEYLEINKDYGFKSIAHLLIVVDEFAELKKENPTIIKELISFSRIGRSLGIHLILATQRPNGSIDEEIWSNSHFKIALKVHSEKDSEDIIRTKDAAFLTNPGDFYLQVDDNTVKAKSIYSKKDINNNDQYEVSLLDNKLKQIKKKTYRKVNPFLESSYLSKLIIENSNTLNIKRNEFDFEEPKPLTINELKNKYINNNGIILGEKDDYLNAKKGILEYKIDENLLIYSNRNNEVNNIINILNSNRRQTIIISNKKYESDYISDSILYEDDEDINYLFNKLINDSSSNITLLIEDVGSLISFNEDYESEIYQLIRRSNVSNYSLILLTKQSNISFKIINSIKVKIAIDIFDSQDLINIFSIKGKYKGKSYFFEDDLITFIPSVIENINSNGITINNYIDYVPLVIKYEYIRNNLLIGYDNKTRKKIFVNDSEQLLISSYDEETIRIYRLLFIQNTNIKVALYSNELVRSNYQNVLWLGDGISSQRLFYVDKEYELNNELAYLFRANKGRVIRPVNNE